MSTRNWALALSPMNSSPIVCPHLLFLENPPDLELYRVQRRTWMRWALADPTFDAKRCLVVFSAADLTAVHREFAPQKNYTDENADEDRGPGLMQTPETPMVTTEGNHYYGNDKWAKRIATVTYAVRAYRFNTLTIADGDIFLCWGRWRNLVRNLTLMAAAAATSGAASIDADMLVPASSTLAPLIAGYDLAAMRATERDEELTEGLFDMHFQVRERHSVQRGSH